MLLDYAIFHLNMHGNELNQQKERKREIIETQENEEEEDEKKSCENSSRKRLSNELEKQVEKKTRTV